MKVFLAITWIVTALSSALYIMLWALNDFIANDHFYAMQEHAGPWHAFGFILAIILAIVGFTIMYKTTIKSIDVVNAWRKENKLKNSNKPTTF